jgi:hypothetical protein
MTTASRSLQRYVGARFAGDLLLLHHPQGHDQTGNFRAVSTVRYLGIEVDDPLNMAEQIEL